MSAIHINDLPDVVLEYVFSLLSPYDELLNCRLVCKKWYLLTYSALHKIKLDFRLAIKNLNIEWSKYTSIDWPNISGRYSHSSCLHSQYMYIFGGCTTGNTAPRHFRFQSNMCTTFNDLWIFDLNKKVWHKPLMNGIYPPPKACASMVTYRDKLYLYGGWTHSSATPLNQDYKLFNDLHVFDIAESSWTLIKPKPNELACPPMAGHSASVIGNKMLVYGGLLYSIGSNFNSICVNKDIYIYDFDTQKWSKKEMAINDESPNPRYGHTQIVLDQTSLAVIGGCSSPKVLYNDIWILKMNTSEWFWKKVTIESTDALSAPIFGFHQAVKVDDMVVFLSNICTNSNFKMSRPELGNRAVFRSDDNNYAQAGYSRNNQKMNEQLSNSNHRLQAQPTQDEKKRKFLASKSSNDNHTDSTTDFRNKTLKSSTIQLKTIRNDHRLKPSNPMFLHVLDFSKVLTNYKVSWLNQIRRLDGPDEIMLYSLIAATNELILFGGIEKLPFNYHNLSNDRKQEIVSNSIYIASPKSFVI